MRKKHADHIRREVKHVYNEIAKEFSGTRKEQWKEFQYFIEIIEKEENIEKVLDLGCGNGRLYGLLQDYKFDYLGADQSAELIKQAKQNFPEAEFKVADMLDTKLPKEHFDIIFSIAAFHHIPGKKLRKKAVQEMHHLLKKDGLLILTTWNIFQWKYLPNILKAVFSFIFHLGFKYAWNDLWIKWAHHPRKRYYHAFLPGEFKSYFDKSHWKIEDFFYVRKGVKTSFWKCFNICITLRKLN